MNNNDKFLELLNQTHTFPGPYVFKVVVPMEKKAEVLNLVLDGKLISERGSKSGKYMSLTIEKKFFRADQVIDQYQSIRTVDGAIVL